MLAHGAVGLGEVGMVGGHLGPQGHGLADQLDGPGRVAALVVHDAEQVQGIGVVRLPGQQGMIAASGIGIAAGLVELPSGDKVCVCHGKDTR